MSQRHAKPVRELFDVRISYPSNEEFQATFYPPHARARAFAEVPQHDKWDNRAEVPLSAILLQQFRLEQ